MVIKKEGFLLVFIILFNYSLGSRHWDIFGNDDGEKKDDKMLAKCIKEPDSKCEDVQKILTKNIKIERVGTEAGAELGQA